MKTPRHERMEVARSGLWAPGVIIVISSYYYYYYYYFYYYYIITNIGNAIISSSIIIPLFLGWRYLYNPLHTAWYQQEVQNDCSRVHRIGAWDWCMTCDGNALLRHMSHYIPTTPSRACSLR